MNISVQIFIIIILYIIIVAFQVFMYKKKVKKINIENEKINNEINFNKENSVKLEEFFHQELTKRKDLLKNMSYQDWINYNQKNIKVNFEGNDYYFTIWNHIKVNETFVLDCYRYKQYLNMEYKNLISLLESHAIYGRKYKLSHDIIKTIFYSNKNPFCKFNYNWIPKEYSNQNQQISISINYDDNKDNQGIIMLSYITKDITQKYMTNYLQMTKNNLYIISFLILMSSIIFIIINRNNNYGLIKSIIFMIILNVYISIFMLKDEHDRSVDSEIKKDQSINSGIISVSFLIAVNIFIISKIDRDRKNTPDNNKYNNIFNESTFLFILILLTLLTSIFKNTDGKIIQDLTKKRLNKELFFNISIFLNIFIIINFGFYIFFSN